MASGSFTSTLPRSSCGKCVKVLKELISGLHDDEGDGSGLSDSISNSNSNTSSAKQSSPPLTLLRAIARSSQQHPHHDQWGQELVRRRRPPREMLYPPHLEPPPPTHDAVLHSRPCTEGDEEKRGARRRPPLLSIEETKDGVKLTIPVETTAPSLMKRWTQLEQQPPMPRGDRKEADRNEKGNKEKNGQPGVKSSYAEWLDDLVPLATSVRSDQKDADGLNDGDNESSYAVANPLTIELKCRRCQTTGPEAGARAFLMGPEPLSIVLCHNRINSTLEEVEEILTHELIHLYDVQTLKLNLADCETVAYSEVRAAREAECATTSSAVAEALEMAERRKGSGSDDEPDARASGHGTTNHERHDSGWPSSLTGMQAVATNLRDSFSQKVLRPYCVKSIALGATQNMFPAKGKACLHTVWETAYADHRPFGTANGRGRGDKENQNTTRPEAEAAAAAASQTETQTQTTTIPNEIRSSNRVRGSNSSGTSHGTSCK